MSWIAPPDEWRILIRLFGPPRVALAEAYADDTTGACFDHRAFDTLLRRHVRGDGRVDHERLAHELPMLDGYVAALAEADFDALSRDEKLALLINAYNAFTLRLVVERRPIASIRNIPNRERWLGRRWCIGGRVVSLHEIESDWLRARFAEPRVHFAINCASVGCPPLRAGAYSGAAIGNELAAHTRAVHANPRWARFDGTTLWLSKVYLWYASDFEQAAGSIAAYAARYMPQLADALAAGARPKLAWLLYDWALNDVPLAA